MKLTILTGALLISGCGQIALSENTTTMEMLKAGSPKVCSDAAVQETLFSLVKPEKNLFSANTPDDVNQAMAQITYALDVITVSKIDKDVSSVTCDADLIITKLPNQVQKFSVTYEIRPSVQDPEHFVISANSNAAQTAAFEETRSALREIEAAAAEASERANASEAVLEPTPEPTPENSVTPDADEVAADALTQNAE